MLEIDPRTDFGMESMNICIQGLIHLSSHPVLADKCLSYVKSFAKYAGLMWALPCSQPGGRDG